MTITFTDPNSGKQSQVLGYLDGFGFAFLVVADKPLNFEVAEIQSGGPFNNQSIGGNYAGGETFLPTGEAVPGVGEFSIDNVNHTVSILGGAQLGTYQMDASGSGRGIITAAAGTPFGSGNAVFYLIDSQRILGISLSGANPFVGRLEQ